MRSRPSTIYLSRATRKLLCVFPTRVISDQGYMTCICVFVDQRLEAKYSSDPSKYRLLYSLVQAEVESKTAKASSSCTNGLLWLTRCFLRSPEGVCVYIDNIECDSLEFFVNASLYMCSSSGRWTSWWSCSGAC